MKQWKPVPGYEDHYQVSSDGQFKRVGTDRFGRRRNTLLKLNDRRGYKGVTLCVDNKPRIFSAHRLVWEAFNGPIPSHLQINHKNGKKADNRLVNLELVTPSQNTAHAYRVLGLSGRKNPNYGEANGRSVLTEDKVREIRELYAQGQTSQTSLAEKYGVDQTAISHIVRRTTWKNVI